MARALDIEVPMKFITQTKKLTLAALRACWMFALIMGLLISPISHALQIQLNTSMKVRQFDDEAAALNPVGVLAAGSIVEIPDLFKVLKKGKVDADATFKKWLTQAGYSRSAIRGKVKDPRLDFYFPIRIVKMAKGSSGKHLIGTTRFMALRVLERSQNGLTVKTKSRVYRGPGESPLKPGLAVPEKHAPRETPIAPAHQAEAEAQTPAQTVPYTPEQTEPPAATEPVQTSVPTAAPLEAGTASSDDCPECDAARDQANSGAANAESLGNTVRDQITPQIYNSESSGAQPLTRGFDSACQAFIKPNGEYGPYGQKVLREISRYPDFLADSRGTANFCPNFNSFSDAQKRRFWVWLSASVAQQEATCNPDARAPLWMNANGHASGLFQIEERVNLRNGRDSQYGGNFCSGDAYDVDVNIRCGIRMMKDLVDNGDGPYAHRNNYWSSLRSPGVARRLISQFEDCGAQTVYASNHHRGHNHRTRRHHRTTIARSAK